VLAGRGLPVAIIQGCRGHFLALIAACFLLRQGILDWFAECLQDTYGNTRSVYSECVSLTVLRDAWKLPYLPPGCVISQDSKQRLVCPVVRREYRSGIAIPAG